MLLQLLCNNRPSLCHVIHPSFVRPLAQAQNTPEFAKLPDAQRLKHGLHVRPFISSMKYSSSTRRVEGMNTPLDRNLGIAQQGFLCEEKRVAFRDSVPKAGL